MADDPTPAPATPLAAPGGGGSPPWHQGIESDVVGTWQNKGYDLTDPKKIAVEVTKAYREAQGKLGVPPDQLVKLLKPDSQPSEIKEFWNRLGAPKDPKEYDFSAVKFADGADLDSPFVDTMRTVFDAAHLPKDAALAITRAMVKYMDDAVAEEGTSSAVRLAAAQSELAKEWGGAPGSTQYESNRFIAIRGANALGITKEQATELESVIGYDGVMKAMHKVGMMNREDRFVAGGSGTNGPMTREMAVARFEDLKNDASWVSRWQAGDVQAKQEWLNLTQIISGQYEAA